MKRISLFIVCCIAIGMYCNAQNMDTMFYEEELIVSDSVLQNDTTILHLVDIMENAIIHQDSTIYQLLLNKFLGTERKQQEINGFRVQVYSSNKQQFAKNESILLQHELEKNLSHPVYIISEPPFWKVRIGDFRTRDEANQYKELLIDLFPNLQSSTYVVPDKITILN